MGMSSNFTNRLAKNEELAHQICSYETEFHRLKNIADVAPSIIPTLAVVAKDPIPAPNLSKEAWNSPALGFEIHHYLRNPGPWYNPGPQTYSVN